LDVTVEDKALLLPVKIVPGARRTRYMGEWNGRARISVAAPPEKGRANKAVEAFLARLLGVSARDVTVVSGQTNPLKTIRISGVELDELNAALRPD
jgi:uncharacterized protein (TIGR00251 family)